MNIRSAVVLGILLLFGTKAFAQDYAKAEVTIDYSYVRFSPQNNNIIQNFSLNGGGGNAAFYITHAIGIEADFQGYASQTRHFTLPASVCTGPCTGNVQGNLFTYNVGPIFKYRATHFEPFAEALFGGAHSNVNGNLLKACNDLGECIGNKSPSNNAFDFIIGGGVDVPVNKSIAIRVAQVDYLLTRFGNNFTHGNNNQSNFRFAAGVNLRF